MLVLTRKLEETIVIGEDIVVKVIRTGSGSVKLGIIAPKHIQVLRGELLEAGKPEPLLPLPANLLTRATSDQFPHVA
ncbi:MAG: carbon storage regulator [Planctomyces sp.]|nr:carbon storage regulator [Planctomyces sp.]